jgi:hypothetical protein
MRAFINGELLGEDSLANMAWTLEELISFASRGSFVGPTDLLASGTHQRGCLTEIWGRAGERVPPPLVPGDVVTCEVEALGVVRNRVVEPDPCPPIPAPRSRPPAAASPEAPATEQASPDSDRSRRGGPRPVRGYRSNAGLARCRRGGCY